MPKDSPQGLVAEHGAQATGELDFVPSVSPAMRALEDAVGTVAGSLTPVLITGEGGSGKRSLARLIHRASGHAPEAFHEIACTALPADFPGPSGNGAAGPLARGTLFLVEIADLAPSAQARLVHTFFNGANGSDKPNGARLIASTRRNLEHEIHAGRFREDLYYRVSGVCLRVPPLRHRKEDIPLLTEHFLAHYARLFGRPKLQLSSGVIRYFLDYAWPGNVRELENALKTIVAVGDERVAMAALRSVGMDARRRNGDSEGVSLKQAARAASRQAERELILKVLSRTRWNRKRAAQELQISYKALLYKLKQIGLDDDVIGPEETLL